MNDPRLIKRFKQVSREDVLIAGVLGPIVGGLQPRSILEVGAGPGTISQRLAAAQEAECAVTVVEPCVEYHDQYTPRTRIVPDPWESCALDEHYDAIIMSHVIGHFPIAKREDLVLRAVDHLTERGAVVVVTNGPGCAFWPLNLAIARTQGWQYVIDFEALEAALSGAGVRWQRHDVTTPLYLGNTMDTCIELMNALFPSVFSDAERRMVENVMRWLWQPRGYVLDLIQCAYVIRPLATGKGTAGRTYRQLSRSLHETA